uniref:Retrotransposon gag domain-containing protein n=1 Tax=Nicotiana tabacum TaxID=4097 RepID=A0A1S3Z9Y5_TOBAC|nr:PREDICTED: uncharacterized protein LOC107784594 [Nicotiana tabacum]
MWYRNLPPNSIDSFAMLADSFLRAHAGTIKVTTRKSDVFKIKQRENEMLRKFVSRFQIEQMELPPVSDDWYQSKIAVEDDQLGVPLGSVYPSRLLTKEQRVTERQSRKSKERYYLYMEDRRNAPRRNIPRGDRRTDQGQSSRGLMSKAGFDRYTGPVKSPRLSEYNFNVDVSDIVSTIGKIKDTKWPKPILSDPSQRNPNLVCKYHCTHGPRTEDCRQLREDLARLISEGHLRDFLSDRDKNQFWEREASRKSEPEEPQHGIHMIVGGADAPQGLVVKRTKISISREKRTQSHVLEGALTGHRYLVSAS